ncbi:hypothetical protein K488DRAFT_81365 [Vararia minispora EC-137]|uniref:Uncharacterized protein n=1 Tax=Vararia minispora EC-137 TaxID=1314806 RepID=A0ACB8R033_9AGAM|nr:hypothetical protein K488DRAFT_81365 [Vararia minispora EC-137]
MPSGFNAPASAPVSPAYTRSQSSMNPPPVTPQRIPRSQRHHDQLQNLFRSPFTPESTLSTPYTPFSFRSPQSQWASDRSALTTPDSAKSNSAAHDQALHSAYAAASPLAIRNKRTVSNPADGADGWRSSANENGIRIDHRHEAFDDDENYPGADGTLILYLLMRPWVLTDWLTVPSPLPIDRVQRLFAAAARRPRAQSQAVFRPAVPILPATPARRTLATLNTPPPHASNVERLKAKGAFTDPACARRRPVFPQSDLFDIEESDYAPYPATFGVDPFDGPPTFASFDDHVRQLSTLPSSPPPPLRERAYDANCCPVCGNKATRLVALAPCAHVLCSACFTSSLNIVGEKNMECAVCRQAVKDFEMRTAPASETKALEQAQTQQQPVRRQARMSDGGSGTVLRIDNVPWDITPPMMRAWLKQPVQRVHILLDRKGKTQSHAFVEMRDEDGARAALRSAQNSVLGRGKRARGVTVTRASQEELMKALFPTWRGAFEGIRPSVRGLADTEQIAALSAGLLDEGELRALLHLIRSPDSHFLKVPSLPFHSLISILEKFPGDDGGRQFWTPALRDLLFDVTLSAIKILAADDSTRGDEALLADFLRTAIHCSAFTQAQRNVLTGLVEASPVHSQSPSPSSSVLSDEYAASGFSSELVGGNRLSGEFVANRLGGEFAVNRLNGEFAGPFDFQASVYAYHGQQQPHPAKLDALAREFRCDPGLIEVLAARIAAGELM